LRGVSPASAEGSGFVEAIFMSQTGVSQIREKVINPVLISGVDICSVKSDSKAGHYVFSEHFAYTPRISAQISTS